MNRVVDAVGDDVDEIGQFAGVVRNHLQAVADLQVSLMPDPAALLRKGVNL